MWEMASRCIVGDVASCTGCLRPWSSWGALAHLPASELQNHHETQDEMKLSLTLCLIHSAAI